MMGERDAAQADQLIRAFCEVRDKTIRQLSYDAATWAQTHPHLSGLNRSRDRAL
jgi:hypothetical protein